jgi:hypothetical protein
MSASLKLFSDSSVRIKRKVLESVVSLTETFTEITIDFSIVSLKESFVSGAFQRFFFIYLFITVAWFVPCSGRTKSPHTFSQYRHKLYSPVKAIGYDNYVCVNIALNSTLGKWHKWYYALPLLLINRLNQTEPVIF